MRHPITDYTLAGIETLQLPPEGHQFDPAKPPKYWRDTNALTSPRLKMLYSVVAYGENGGLLIDSKGRPMLDEILLTKSDAFDYNIPSPETGPGKDARYPIMPVPLRALLPTEQLVIQGPMGIVMVDDGVQDTTTVGAGLTKDEHDILLAIMAGIQQLLDAPGAAISFGAAAAAPRPTIFDLLQYIQVIGPIIAAIQAFRAMDGATITKEMVDSAFASAGQAGAEIFWLAWQKQHPGAAK